MCLNGLKGRLRKRQAGLSLLLPNITAEQAQEILDLCDGEIRFVDPHNNGIGISLESDSEDLRTIALDLGDEGARIEMDHDVSNSLKKEGFLKAPVYARRSTPTGWELLGNRV